MATKKNECGVIHLTVELAEHLSCLYMNSDFSDVIFTVEGVKMYAHRSILAIRSSYFRALLYGDLRESTQSDIELKVPLEAFKSLLKFMYTGSMALNKMKFEVVIDSLALAHQYGFGALESAISDYLIMNVSQENCCEILDAAQLYNLQALGEVCMTFLDQNISDLFTSSNFRMLSEQSLCALLSRDSFFAPEIKLFNGVNKWYEHNPEGNIEMVLSEVRFPLMTMEQLLEIVRPSPLLDADQVLDAIQEKNTSENIRYRGALWPEKNVASAKYNSKVICGDRDKSALLNGDVKNYDRCNGFTSHEIAGLGDKSIIVELGTISVINHIEMLLWDKDSRSYSYYIETSADLRNWTRVIDYTEYHCRSWQFLYFKPHVVRYIKLVGTRNTVNEYFCSVALEAYHTAKLPALLNGIISPTHNVATSNRGAVVIKGHARNELLNGNILSDASTYHIIDDGGIIVQLGQPYHIESLRLLLWNGDEITYSFYIETSMNNKDWEMAVDKRNEQLRSWQQFTFTARPVTFIKIVGTANTANTNFHCTHFECPSKGGVALN